MFKLTIKSYEALCGEYFTTTRVAFGKSPKQARAKLARYNGEHTVSGGHPSGYGGVPIMDETTLQKNGKIIYQTWN